MIRSFKKPSGQALALNPYIVEICRGVVTMRSYARCTFKFVILCAEGEGM